MTRRCRCEKFKICQPCAERARAAERAWEAWEPPAPMPKVARFQVMTEKTVNALVDAVNELRDEVNRLRRGWA